MAIGIDGIDGSVAEMPQQQTPHVEGRRRRILGFVLATLAIVASLATFALITNITPIEPTAEIMRPALVIDGILILGLVVVVLWESWRLWQAWYEGRAGARLHLRIVALFSLMAALPAGLVAAAFAVTIDQGLDRWFETRTRQVVDNVLTVASAYMQEHARVLRGDLIGLANVIDAAKPLYDFEPSRFDTLFEGQAKLRGVQGAYLLDTAGGVLLRAEFANEDGAASQPTVTFVAPPAKAMTEAEKGGAVIISPGSANQVGGVLKLRAYDDTYLYVVRQLDANVLNNLRLAQESAVEYRELEASRADIQLGFGMVFAGLTVVFLLAAVWVGLAFSTALVAPIRRLIGAAGEVANGNLDAAVPVGAQRDDLASLSVTFNDMTRQLRTQRRDLLAANDQVDRRRRFTEAVLAGVTPSVVGVSNNGHVSIVNPSATDLFGLEEFDLIGRRLMDVLPELEPLLTAAMRDDNRVHQGVITLLRKGRERTVSVRVASDRSPDREHGYVVTLDDISDLVTAQRTSAWADVARRIAHEIKNPLTPIQLSAERIRRRFGKRIEDADRPVFDQCVDTIVRQVGDIGRMVDEFSSFARMPKPTMDLHDLAQPIKEAIFLQSVAHPDIAFESVLPDRPLKGRFDHRLMSQVVTNIVKNAVEAITAVPAEERGDARVTVRAREEGEAFVVDIIDTGIGLPVVDRQRLLEPYMTTREKGTGLGLAIVRKIIEEHHGSIELLDAPAVAEGRRGAMVRIRLPRDGSGAGSLREDALAASH